MRLLADENLNRLDVQMLRAGGHDVVWIAEETPGIDDQAVLSRATTEERILLTADKEDFGELVFRDKQKAPYGIILFRIHNQKPSERAQTIILALESRTNWKGHFSSVRDENNIRMKPLPTNTNSKIKLVFSRFYEILKRIRRRIRDVINCVTTKRVLC